MLSLALSKQFKIMLISSSVVMLIYASSAWVQYLTYDPYQHLQQSWLNVLDTCMPSSNLPGLCAHSVSQDRTRVLYDVQHMHLWYTKWK